MKGPVEVHLWDLNNHTNWKVVLSEQPSTSRQLTVGFDYLVTFIQTLKNVSDAERLKSGLIRRSTNKSYPPVDEAVIQIFDRRASALQTIHFPGWFSGVGGTSSESTAKRISEGLVAYRFHEGAFKVQRVKSNQAPRTFTVNNSEITAVTISSNGGSAVVGCANGNVHIIQMIQIINCRLLHDCLGIGNNPDCIIKYICPYPSNLN